MDLVTKNFCSLSVLVKSHYQQKLQILKYCHDRSITPFLQGIEMLPRSFIRAMQAMPIEVDAETWGKSFDCPEPENSTPVSLGTIFDNPLVIEDHFYQVSGRIWSELMVSQEAGKELYWREVLWDEITRSAQNWVRWSDGEFLLLEPPFKISPMNYHPLYLEQKDYLSLENWLLKNPPAQVRRRNKLEPTELEELIQRAYRSQLSKDNTRWSAVLKALAEHTQPGDKVTIPRNLSDPSKSISLHVAGDEFPQTLRLSTFQKNCSGYRTGKRKITLTK